MADITKHALASSLLNLLQQKRLDRITIQEIVDGASVNRQTFYYHFADIFALTRYMVFDLYERAMKEAGIAHDNFFSIPSLEIFLRLVNSNKAVTLNIYRGMDELHLKRALHDILDADIESEVKRLSGGRLSEADVKFAVAFYSSGYYGIFLEWINDDLDEVCGKRMLSMLSVLEVSLKLLVDKLFEKRQL